MIGAAFLARNDVVNFQMLLLEMLAASCAIAALFTIQILWNEQATQSNNRRHVCRRLCFCLYDSQDFLVGQGATPKSTLFRLRNPCSFLRVLCVLRLVLGAFLFLSPLGRRCIGQHTVRYGIERVHVDLFLWVWHGSLLLGCPSPDQLGQLLFGCLVDLPSTDCFC